MCPRPKILGCCILWTKCPSAICLWPNHPIPLIGLSEATPDFQLPRALALRSGGVLCVGRACIWRWGANPIILVRGIGEAGQTPHWSIRCQRPTEAAIAADRASSMLDAVQGRDTSFRDTISKGRFVQGAQHPRIFGRGHIGQGHINPASLFPTPFPLGPPQPFYHPLHQLLFSAINFTGDSLINPPPKFTEWNLFPASYFLKKKLI